MSRASAETSPRQTSPRQTLRFDSEWRFFQGDISTPIGNKHIAAYMANKAGWARGAAKPSFDDSDWRTVDFPHDWSVEGEFDPENHVDAGFLPRGIGWYRRHFRLEESDRGKYLAIRFDGIATHATIFVNGHLLQRHYCGYTPCEVDISDVATFGDSFNTVAVRVDATPMEGWWYEGAGIYRHVSLIKTSRNRIAPDGLSVRTVKRDATNWDTEITADIVGGISILKFEILDSDGAAVGSATGGATTTIAVKSPRLWSIDEPNLYSLRAMLAGGSDELTVRFGYRSIRFDANDGFFLNDRPLKLKGTCNHQDHAGVGVAVPDSIHEFRIRRLKEMGSNAYRCAHNPPAPELLDACDRLGMLVIDENRTFGSDPENLSQLAAMVKRDRNHPSVILWSICNEEAIQGTSVGAKIAKSMQALVKQLDPSRPVTAAVSGGVLNDDCVADSVEIVGVNYLLHLHDGFHKKHPKTPMFASETHCLVSTRGVKRTDPERFVFAGRDSEKLPWGELARTTWKHIRERPFVAGLFAWTGFDYRGEPSPHAWPCVNSQFGVMDTCGFPKDAFYLHKAWWSRDPFVHLIRADERTIAYTNCDEAELFCDGKSLGKRRVDPIEMVEWTAPRAESIRCIGFREGRETATAKTEPAGPPAELRLEVPEGFSEQVPADGRFAVPVTVFAVDAQNRRVPCDMPVQFSLTAGRILGVGNGNPTSHEPDKSDSRRLFNGLAQVIVESPREPDEFQLTARSEGLREANLKLIAVPASVAPSVPPQQFRHFIIDWRVSPQSASRLDPNLVVTDSDMNTWERVRLDMGGKLPAVAPGKFVIDRASISPRKDIVARGGALVFAEIRGKAIVCLNGATAGQKADVAPGRMTVPITAGTTSITLSILIEAGPDQPGGITRSVELAAT